MNNISDIEPQHKIFQQKIDLLFTPECYFLWEGDL